MSVAQSVTTSTSAATAMIPETTKSATMDKEKDSKSTEDPDDDDDDAYMVWWFNQHAPKDNTVIRGGFRGRRGRRGAGGSNRVSERKVHDAQLDEEDTVVKTVTAPTRGTFRGRRPHRGRVSQRDLQKAQKIALAKIDPFKYPSPVTELDHWLCNLAEQLILDDQGSLGSYVCYKAGDLSHAEGKGDVMDTSGQFDHYVERVLLAEAKVMFTLAQIEWMDKHIVEPFTLEMKVKAKITTTKEEEIIQQRARNTQRFQLAGRVRTLLTNNARAGEYDNLDKIDLGSLLHPSTLLKL